MQNYNSEFKSDLRGKCNNASSQFANVSSGLLQLGNKITSAGSMNEETIQEITQSAEKRGEVLDE